MKKNFLSIVTFALVGAPLLAGCQSQTKSDNKSKGKVENRQTVNDRNKSYTEGADYMLYERVRLWDKNGFSNQVEAYSILLPKGWTQEGDIVWTRGTSCDGTSSWLKAKSADGKYSLEIFPNKAYRGVDDANPPENNGGNCGVMQPLEAEAYLRRIFAPNELNNPEVVKVEMNNEVVAQMRQKNEAFTREMQQYGAGRISFNQTAVNANLRWTGRTEGFVILGVNITIGEVPNIYNGSSSTIYTTNTSHLTVFKYPKGESENAKYQFSAIMSSIRTNTAWLNAVNNYWKNVRQQSNVMHQNRIRMNDELTRSMGNAAIQRGKERLNNMDLQMRSWEQQQNAQDRMHTSFIKTIRGVENYRDETGTYEMSSSYSHAWSRGDGNSFVMSNNPNFDPQFVLKDQQWKAMKKVE